MNVGIRRSSPNLLKWSNLSSLSAKESYDSTRLTCCSQIVSGFREHHRFNRRVMGFEYIISVCWVVTSNSHITLLAGRSGKYCLVFSIWVKCTETFRVIASVNSIYKSEVSEVIHINSVL